MKLKLILLTILAHFSLFASSQDDEYRYYEVEEDSLNLLFEKIQNEESDSIKFVLNDKIIDLLEYTLYDDNSFTRPLDSVRHFGILSSEDELLKLYNWNILLSDNTYKYFGFIQYYKKDKGEYLIYKLNDMSDVLEATEKQILSNENWFGALYYQIIENKDDKYTYYTLLGWDGNNEWSSKKIVDVLYFSNSGKPRFGANIFYTVRQGDKRNRKVRQKRIIFEYNSSVNMTLRYDSKLKMIVFDNLSPNESSNYDKFRYYGPDWTYSGLKFKKGKWRFYEDLDPRNPKTERKSARWNYKKEEDVYSK